MKIYLIRHGEKSAHGGANPGLSSHGQDQARALAQAVSKNELEKPDEILASPKMRTHETMAPLSKLTGLQTRIVPEVDERKGAESHTQFIQRTVNFLDNIETLYPKASVIYVCSHMDWLEVALEHIQENKPQNFPAIFHPGEWVLAELETGGWKTLKKGLFL
ncbi:MAG: histidine phosphatase family protein [Pseudobdellovibrionaceae bacterium]